MDIPGELQLGRPRRRRKRHAVVPQQAPIALTLVGAEYDSGTWSVTLVFDRAVSIAAFDGAQIVVADADNGWLLQGAWASLDNPVTVQVGLDQVGSAEGSGVLLDAGASSGIVAVDDASAWAGVENLQLPFP